jgi:hypothetical protein
MTLFYLLLYLLPGNLSCCHSKTPRVSAPHALIPPVLYLFYHAGVRRAERRQLALALAVTILP